VHGLDLATVAVSVTLTDPDLADPDTVTLSSTTKTPWDPSAPVELTAPLVRTSGTSGNGTYRAKVHVPSSAHGSWRVGYVTFGTDINSTSVDPRDSGLRDATLKVTGTHRPRMRFSVSPQPLPYPRRVVTVSARMSYDDTGTSITGRWVFFDVDCEMGLGRSGQVRTDRHGLARFRAAAGEVACAWMPFPLRSALTDATEAFAGGSRTTMYGTRTTAVPSKTSARRGTRVAVTGHAFAVLPVAGNPVVLQRRVGRHWRTVGTATVRPSGRFTLVAHPPKGCTSYRAVLTATGQLVASTSRVFVLRGT
jgi:hypothetical protein